MIKAIIYNAAGDDAKRLTFLLVHHPDVELVTAYAPELKGQRPEYVVPGLIGDTDLTYADTCDFSDGNVVFLFQNTDNKLDINSIPQDVKVIEVTRTLLHAPGFVDGVPEVNRKLLVRGAMRAVVPDAYTAMTVVALAPVVTELGHGSEVTVKDVYPQTMANGVEEKLSHAVKILHNTYPTTLLDAVNKDNTLKNNDNPGAECEACGRSERFGMITLDIDSSLDLHTLEHRYRERYQDHNFVYFVDRQPKAEDVVGTGKCVLYLQSAEEGKLRITVAADLMLKGGVAVAVHLLNLLFGLHERTGLNLTPHWN